MKQALRVHRDGECSDLTGKRLREVIVRSGGEQIAAFFFAEDSPWFGHDGNLNYEPEVVDAMCRFVKPGDKVIDAGANIGFFTLLLSQLVGSDGSVMAFEPHPETYGELICALHFNAVNNVLPNEIALAQADGHALLWALPRDSSGYSSLWPMFGATARSVQMRALDSILAPDWRPRLIKLDCEGAEEAILRGAERTLRLGVDCVIVEFNFTMMRQTEQSEATIREYLDALGYQMFLLRRGGGRPMHIPIQYELVAETCHNFMFATEELVTKAWGGFDGPRR